MLKILRKNLRKSEVGLILLSIVFIVIQVWLDLKTPDYMSEITILVETEGSEMSEILSAGGKMLACCLGSMAACVITAVLTARISATFGGTLRYRLFRKVQAFSTEEIGHFSTASLITRSTNDVTQIQMLLAIGLQMIIKAPVMAVWAILKISTKQWQWTFSTAVAVVILLIIVGICIFLALPKFKKMQFLTDDLNRVTRENLSGLRVVRAYNAEDYQEEKFEKANEILTGTQLYTQRVMAFLLPSVQIVMSGLALAIYWIGAALVNQVGMAAKLTTFSDMVVFSQYAMQVVMAFMLLVIVFMFLPRASVAAARICEVLETKPAITDGTRTEGLDGVSGEIEFDHVAFRYPDAEEDVLEGITFSAKKGETVAIIGATGSGKSSVINLIPRFYDVSEGEVKVDGVNVKEYSMKALRNKIGYISQSAVLFSGDIRDNIAYGDNGKPSPSDDEICEAITVAQAADFVDCTPEGLSAYVAQGGTNFSGGQKQRLSIARAIARKPEILIFDDSFSALDYKTDRTLREKLNEECAGVTRIIVAQRIGTIRDADRIIVLENGKIAGTGRHDELMKNCGTYREIALSQLSMEELA